MMGRGEHFPPFVSVDITKRWRRILPLTKAEALARGYTWKDEENQCCEWRKCYCV